jgi:alpha-glucosidase
MSDCIIIASPDGEISFQAVVVEARRTYSTTFKDAPMIESSPLGIVVDGVNLAGGVEAGTVESYRAKEACPCRGVHSQAVHLCNCNAISLKHESSGAFDTLDVRACEDRIAVRYAAPGDDRQRVPDEACALHIPEGSTVWCRDLHGHYEGVHARRGIADLQAGEWAALP